MDLTVENVAAALNDAGLAARVWAKGKEPRVYIQIDRRAVQAELGLTSSQARQMERQGGVYVELTDAEALVQGAVGSAEQKIIGALTSAGLSAR